MSNQLLIVVKQNIVNRALLLLILISGCFMPPTALGSSSAGIDIRAGAFSIEVYYNTVVEYPSRVDGLIRDPRHLLFDLMTFVDSNYDALSRIDRRVRIDLLAADSKDMEDVAMVEEAGPGARDEITKFKVDKNVSEKIVELLCSYLREEKCVTKKTKTLVIYGCQSESCPGKIRFGNVPSDEPPKFSLRPKSKGAPRFIINKHNIGERFERLR
jgi:hypothetical protein